MFIGESTDFFDGILGINIVNNYYDIPFNIPTFYKFLPLFTSIFFGGAAYVLAEHFTTLTTVLQIKQAPRLFYLLFNKKWFFDSIYSFIGYKILNSGYTISYKFFDKGLLELMGPYGLTNTVSTASQWLAKLHNGYITNALQLVVIGAICLINIILLMLI